MNMDVPSYQKLTVWQKAMELAKEVYSVVKLLPKEEIYALSNQMRRAAVSIPSNIAEGQARNSMKEFLQFLAIAQGKPYYAVFRDSSFASDSTLVNFEQIFRTYSPTTIRKVL